MPSGVKLGIEGTTSSQQPTSAFRLLSNKMFLKIRHVLHCAECWCHMVPPGALILEMALGKKTPREEMVAAKRR